MFTGNVDLDLLEQLLKGDKVAIVGLQTFADGQHPLSLENLRATRFLADRYGKRLVLDGSRIIENAWFIQRHEPGMSSRSIAGLVKEIAKTAHIFQIDGAQDPKCPAGGLLATDNPGDHERFMNEVVVYEGLHTYGGMAGRTMEVFARGLEEMCIESEVQWVMQQTEAFNERLFAA
ncbi:MAG: tyrosine phenol-lyase, partial [Actinomycetia bacterium]|nr:tyrosine phenol-lyase [Actinomycetes bacterium]